MHRGDEAVAIYRDVLAAAADQHDALVMASADLVQQQRHALVQELITPAFAPGRTHPHVGIALLHHHLQTQNREAGAALLHQMYLHYDHMVAGELQPFTGEFDRLRPRQLPPPRRRAERAHRFLRLDRPICSPDW